MSRQRRLGRGLDALLGAKYRTPEKADEERESAAAVEVRVEELRPGRCQPRSTLSDDGLAELADSIREQGVIQPLVVRPIPAAPGASPEPAAQSSRAVYEIVAGERRWRAAKMAGLSTVPVVVRELDDRSALAVALIENLQREDLNPMDQARSLSRLAEEFGLTHEQIAKAVGRSRAAVSNLLRLLDLTDEVKDMLADGRIDMGHARALLPLDPERQAALARRTVSRRLSVRQVEGAVKALLAEPASDRDDTHVIDLQTRWLQRQIAQELGQKLAIRPGKDGTYTLHLAFGDLAQLQETLQRIRDLIGQVRDTAGPRARDANG